MNFIKVIDIFPNTSLGFLAVLQFPENEYPQIGMVLKNSGNETWKITSKNRGKNSKDTNGYKDLPETILFSCIVKSDNENNVLKKGELLYK